MQRGSGEKARGRCAHPKPKEKVEGPGIELCPDKTIRSAKEGRQIRCCQRAPENMMYGLFNVSIQSSETMQDIEGLGGKSQY